jgi:hypothetical protein
MVASGCLQLAVCCQPMAPLRQPAQQRHLALVIVDVGATSTAADNGHAAIVHAIEYVADVCEQSIALRID